MRRAWLPVCVVTAALLGVLLFVLDRSGVWWISQPSAPYARALLAARRLSPEVRQFDHLFPSAHSYISYFDGSVGVEPVWNGELTTDSLKIIASAPITLSNTRRRQVLSVGPLQVLVLKTAHGTTTDGRPSETYSDQLEMTLAEMESRIGGASTEAARLDMLEQSMVETEPASRGR